MTFTAFATTRERLVCRKPECVQALRSGRSRTSEFIQRCLRKASGCCAVCGETLV